MVEEDIDPEEQDLDPVPEVVGFVVPPAWTTGAVRARGGRRFLCGWMLVSSPTTLPSSPGCDRLLPQVVSFCLVVPTISTFVSPTRWSTPDPAVAVSNRPRRSRTGSSSVKGSVVDPLL